MGDNGPRDSHPNPQPSESPESTTVGLPFRLVPVPTSEPIAAFVASLLGGLVISVGGYLLVVNSAAVHAGYDVAAGQGANYGWAGISLGVLVMALATIAWIDLRHIVQTGLLIVLLALLSLISGGGFLVGTGLAVAGGLMAMSWEPGPAYALVPPEMQICSQCGLPSRADRGRCRYCHEKLP